MKNKKLLDNFSLVDEKYVEEADPDRNRKKAPLWWKRFAYIAVAACLMLVIVLPIMFGGGHESVPVATGASTTAAAEGTQAIGTVPSHLLEYKDSPYYPLIEKLDAYYQEQNRHDNWEGGDDVLGGDVTMGSVMTNALPDPVVTVPSVGAPDTPDDPDLPPDITDNQVEGVSEADRIKRTATHIFYLRNLSKIEAYTIKGLDSSCVGSFSFSNADCEGFYLLDGGKKILIVANSHNDRLAQTLLILLDVSDPTQMKEIKRVAVSGYVSDSRVSDGSILLFADYFIWNEPDYHDPSTYVPVVKDGNQVTPLPCDDIIMPESISGVSYGVIYSLDSKTLEFEGSKAFLCGMGVVYVSQNNVFVARSQTERYEQGGRQYRNSVTTIRSFPYGNGSFEQKGVFTLDGYLKDQYSMDEKDGILRVVTTVDCWSYRIKNEDIDIDQPMAPDTVIPVPDTVIPVPDTGWYDPPLSSEEVTAEIAPVLSKMTVAVMTTEDPSEETVPSWDNYLGASLYCVSLDSFEVVASVERFAPDGETVRSVRFDGNYAYVCTSVSFTDPVFFFNLSDLNNITYTDTGVIEGYSSSLVNFENGNLLGIGYANTQSSLKIEIWREENGSVISVDKYVEGASFAEDYKAYYIDRENQLIGIGVYGFKDGSWTYRYLLLHFDGEKLVKLVDLNDKRLGPPYTHRAVYIDGYLYVFGQDLFKVLEVTIPNA